MYNNYNFRSKKELAFLDNELLQLLKNCFDYLFEFINNSEKSDQKNKDL